MKFVLMMLITGTALLAQAPSSATAFEVAVVKLSPADAPGRAQGMKVDKAQFVARHESLKTLILWAYRVKNDQVIGPEWLDTVYLDIEAKMPDEAKEDQARLMLQTLLADRLKMAVHRENREQPIYALVVGKNGLKMKEQESIAEPNTTPTPGSTTVGLPGEELRLSQTRNSSTLSGGGVKMTRDRNGMHVEASQVAALVGFLPEMVERPVVDKTNLKGSYAIRLDISMDEMMHGAQDPGGPETAFLNAVEKLGLKLEPQKGLIEALVVDHIERMPSEN